MKKLICSMLSMFIFGLTLFAADASSFKTPEYNLQWALDKINAADAYAAGFTGKNVIVTVLDSGINALHPEFSGKITNKSYDFLADTSNMIDYEGHGSGVAGIIAALKDDEFMHGVAFDSKINMFAMLSEYGDNSTPAVREFIRMVGTKISNNSWGLPCVDEEGELTGACFKIGPDDPLTSLEINRKNNILLLQEKASPGVYSIFKEAIGKDKIFVFAAGNDAQSQVAFDTALPLMPGYEGLKDQWIVVVATNKNGDIASYSNVCGAAKDMCIAAPGGDYDFTGTPYADETTLINLPGNPPDNYYMGAGTSQAAPLVSGTLALVQEAFPYMTAEQMVQTVFTTANNEHMSSSSYTIPSWHGTDPEDTIAGKTYDYSSIFGHGMLDAGKAVLGPAEFTRDWTLNTMIFDSVFANDISGAGGLTKYGVSTLIMSGNNTYVGNTIINGGRLEVNGSLASKVVVNAGGNLGGSGAISGAVDNYGLISNGHLKNGQYTPYTLTLGNVINYSGGVLGFSVSAAETTAFNITNLTANANSILKPIALYVIAGNQYDIIDVSGTFTNPQNFSLDVDWSALPFITASLSYDSVNKKIVMNVTRADYAAATTSVSSLSENAAQTLGIIDSIYMYSDPAAQAKLNVLYNMSDAQKIPLLESMGANQISSALIINNIDVLNQMIFQRMRANYGNENSPQELSRTASETNVFWIQPFASYEKQKGDSSVGTDGYSGLSEGIFFGVDFSRGEDFYWGASFGFGYSDLEQKNFGTKKTVEDYRIGIYENAGFDKIIVRGSASMGIEKYSSKRNIMLADLQANAEYGSFSINGEWDVLYKDKDNSSIFPFFGLDFTYMKRNKYTESGAGLFNLNVDSNNISIVGAKAGIEGYLLKNSAFSLDAQAYYRRLLSDNRIKNKAYFDAFDYEINTYETLLDKDIVSAGAQMIFSINGYSKIYLNGFVEAGKTSTLLTGSAGLNMEF
ncbi:MAG: S8 family serine peptidase [Elusimicrobiota bacterium]|jgi:subtilase-type serine protease|nr:S8 family serine peptidase [Elusimicrobiota bacterium]